MGHTHTEGLGWVPSRLGRFELRKPLGLGGMARIFLAQDGTAPGAPPVVIKLIHEHYATEDAFVRMFVDEANIAMSMRHPNVARVMELHHVDGRLFMVLEHVDGIDLARLLTHLKERGALLDPEVAAYITHGVVSGLHHAHHALGSDGQPLGVIHRDVSPSNVLLGRDGSVKVADFGVAKALGRLTHSAPGELKGKYCYMPPEMVLNGTCDQRGDLFGAGVVLWEALLARRLFDGVNEVLAMGSVLKQPITPPQVIHPLVGEVLGGVCMRALERRPDRRFQTAAEMASALAGYLGNIPHAVLAGALARTVAECTGAAAAAAALSTSGPAAGVDRAWLDKVTRKIVTPPPDERAVTAPGYVSLLHVDGLPAPPSPAQEIRARTPGGAVSRLVPPPVVHEDAAAITPRMRPLSPDELAVAFGHGPISVPGQGGGAGPNSQPHALLVQILGAKGLAVSGMVTAVDFWRLLRKPALPTDLKVSLVGHAPMTLEALGPLLAVDHLTSFVPRPGSLALRGRADAARLATLCGSLDARNATAALVLEPPTDSAPLVLFVEEGRVHHVMEPRDVPLLEHLLRQGGLHQRSLDALFHQVMTRRVSLMDALRTTGQLGVTALRAAVDGLNTARLSRVLQALPLDFSLHLDVPSPVPLPRGGPRVGQLFQPGALEAAANKNAASG